MLRNWMFLIFVLLVPTSSACAQRVMFDVGQVVAGVVREDSTAEFDQIIFPLSISVIQSGGKPGELVQCEFEIIARQPAEPIVDFEPKTKLVTDVQGSVSYSRDFGNQRGQEIGGGGQVDGVLHAELSASSSSHQSTSAHFERLPSRELLTAAGTTRRGTGVFFKMRKTSQTTLEGAQPFSITMELPSAWRAGYLRVMGRPTLEQGGVQASQSFLVPIYREGDAEAEALAEAMITAEHRLLMMARVQAKQVARARRPTWAHQLSLTDPELPRNWLELTIWGDPDLGETRFERALPQTIQHA
ncbi:MAG: hypothetical protein AAGF97_17390, partial [Planctomycetota bacterium]